MQVDHVLTDPPYEAEAHTKLRRNLGRKEFNGRRDIQNAALDFGAITEEVRSGSATLMAKACKGWALVFCQPEAIGTWRAALEAGGAKWRRAMV